MACTRRKGEPVTSNSLTEKSSHFFKVILPSSLEKKKLGIPKMFVKKFGNELSDIATLEVPNGLVWLIGLLKDGSKIWFWDGWHDFVQYHSISVGYFLVFKYLKDSTFQVLIFDSTACDIDYPYNAVKSKPQGSADNSKLKPEKSHDVKESGVCNIKINDGQQLYALLEDMEICIPRTFKYITVGKRERVLTAARLFKPKNPSFIVMLRASDMFRGYLYVPTKFARKYFTSDDSITTLFNGRESSGHILYNRGRCELTRMGGFLKDNNLTEGDICVFEMLKTKKKTKNTLLKLSVLSESI